MVRRGVKLFILAFMCLGVFVGPLAAQMGGPSMAPGLDGEFLRVASKLPGFAGYFFDDNGDLNVYLTDLSRAADARTLLAPVARNRGQRWLNPYTREAAIITRQAVYDITTLHNIRTRLANEVAAMDGVVMFDTDEVNNHVTVGVLSEKSREAVLSRVSALQLPPNSFSVEVVPDGHPIQTLSDNVRPLVAGLQIDFLGTENPPVTHHCTLGINALYGNSASALNPAIPAGTPGFFTASHCSNIQANMVTVNGQTSWINQNSDGTVYTQGGSQIGVEGWDPPTFKHAQDLNCNDQYGQCRYSDATWVKYDQSIANPTPPTPPGYAQGMVAQTLFRGLGSGSVGSTTLSGSDFVATSLVLPVAGMTLERIGYHAGWTEGNVTSDLHGYPSAVSATCFDWRNLESNIWILCNYEVAAGALDGDSGSPVFQITSGNNIAFSGIAWWATNTGNYFFSHEDNIKRDFGLGINFLNH